MMLAENLGLTLEQVLELSTLEIRMWAAYYSNKRKEQERAMSRGRSKHRR